MFIGSDAVAKIRYHIRERNLGGNITIECEFHRLRFDRRQKTIFGFRFDKCFVDGAQFGFQGRTGCSH